MIVVNPPSSRASKLRPIAFSSVGDVATYVSRADAGSSYHPARAIAYTADDKDEWLPDIFANHGRLTMFIAGPPGAGKTVLAKKMIDLFPPEYQILLFTAVAEADGHFADLGTRINKIRMELPVLRDIDLPKIRQRIPKAILLFDDIDKISDRKIKERTYAILDDAIVNGRGHAKHDGEGDIHVIVTSHALNDYKQTKCSLENCEYIALFPGYTAFSQFARVFEKIGMDKTMCKDVFDMAAEGVGKSRYIIIHTNVPKYMIFGDMITAI